MNDPISLDRILAALSDPCSENLCYVAASLTRVCYADVTHQYSILQQILQLTSSQLLKEHENYKDRMYILQILSEINRISPSITLKIFDSLPLKSYDYSDYLNENNPDEMNDETIRFFNYFVIDIPLNIASMFQKQIPFLLQYISKKDVITRRLTLRSFSVFTEKYVIRPFYAITPMLVKFFTDDDEHSRQFAEKAYKNIMKFLPKNDDLKLTIEELINIVVNTKITEIKQKCMYFINEIVKNNVPNLNSIVIDRLEDIFKIVDSSLNQYQYRFEPLINNYIEFINEFIQLLVTFTTLNPRKFLDSEVVLNMIDEIIISGFPFNNNMRTICLLSWKVPHGNRSQEILDRFTRDLLQGIDIENISHVLLHCKFKLEITNSPLISALKYVLKSGPANGISKSEICDYISLVDGSGISPANVPKITNTVEMNEVLKQNFNFVDYLKYGTFYNIHKLLKENSESAFDISSIEKLRDMLMDLLLIACPAHNPLFIKNNSFNEIMNSQFKLRVVVNKMVLNFTGPFIDTFGSLEFYINSHIFHVPMDSLKEIIPDYEKEKPSFIAAVARQIQLPGYKELAFEYSGKLYGSDDFINEAITEGIKMGQNINTADYYVRVICSNEIDNDFEIENKKKYIESKETKSYLMQDYKNALEILKEIHNKFNSIPMKVGNKTEILENRLKSILKEFPLATVSKSNFVSEIVQTAPFLFSFQMREMILRFGAFGSFSAADHYSFTFLETLSKYSSFSTNLHFKTIEQAIEFVSNMKQPWLKFNCAIEGINEVVGIQELITEWSKRFVEKNKEFWIRGDGRRIFLRPEIPTETLMELRRLCRSSIASNTNLSFAPSKTVLELATAEDISNSSLLDLIKKGLE